MNSLTVPRVIDFVARAASLLAGIALLVGTTLLVFDDPGAVSVAVVIVGALLVVAPLIVDRLERFSFGGQGFEFQLTRQIASLGAPKGAGILEETGLARDLETYSFVYRELTDPALLPVRKELLDKVIARASGVAMSRKFDPHEVRALFTAGSPVMRVLVLGLMEGDPSLVDADVLRSAISDSRTGNEQYHGLKLLERVWCRLPSEKRTEFIGVIGSDRYIPLDPDRQQLATRIVGTQC
jgi:hypothetical protein